MKTLLITGFSPFDGGSINPSWEAVKALPDQIGIYELCKLQIPTEFTKAADIVAAQAEICGADLILSVGMAAGRDAVTPERIAVNIRDAQIPDNAGYQACGERIVPEGPAAYFATVPVEKMAQSIRDAGIRSRVSNTAGAYVCNDVFYTLLHKFQASDCRVGFIHVPQLPQQGTPNMTLDTITTALEIAIAACD